MRNSITDSVVIAVDDDAFFSIATALRANELGALVNHDGLGEIDLGYVRLSRRPIKPDASWRTVLKLPGSRITRDAIERAAARELEKAMNGVQRAAVNLARHDALTEISGPSTASVRSAEPRNATGGTVRKREPEGIAADLSRKGALTCASSVRPKPSATSPRAT